MFYRSIFAKLLTLTTRGITQFPIPKPFRFFAFKVFAKTFGVNLDEAGKPLNKYNSFDAFFTRTLKPDSRPYKRQSNLILSPSDGKIQAYGKINKDSILQAKGVHYHLENLYPLDDFRQFIDGEFITIYLSPKDCHLIFSPVAGRVKSMCHVPGALYPVREPYISKFKGLYTKNERVVTRLETLFGPVAVIAVAALNVGNMTMAYDKTFSTNYFHLKKRVVNYDRRIEVRQADHLASFHLGSTVICLFPKNTIAWENLKLEQTIKYGETIAKVI
ncbi:phosphatidylserine decarboxylase [Candidatus Marinamargulisbacteria bacterium SCGC AAA071-K20]|nr:phosphatidylserine decarboxylase [Candidatus Marinamargulisbacteria bacterium SCGC AAA071-K20]